MAVNNARLYREARQAREEAEAASRAKDRFLAVLSHELRTPLTPVLAEASAMLDDPATPESVRPFLEMTRRNVELEARLIDDLLDLSRIGQGKLRLDREVVDAHRLIRQAVEICRAEAEAAGLRPRARPRGRRAPRRGRPGPAPAGRLEPDQERRQVHPDRRARSRSGPATADGRLVVEVADTGVGIDPEALARIFDAFEQGGDAVTQRFGGLGLGLAISRSLAEAHGGRLDAASPGRGRGATFTLELPTVDGPVPDRRGRRPPPRTAPARRRRSGSCWSRTTPTRSGSWPGCSRARGHQVATADERRLGRPPRPTGPTSTSSSATSACPTAAGST